MGKHKAEYHKKYYQKNKEKAKANNRKNMLKRLERGLCKLCNNARLPNSKYLCEKHYILSAARTALNISTNEVYYILKGKLDKQKWLCPYTGKKLVLGENTHLDHIFPTSRFPELRYSAENLEWVLDIVNLAKSNLTKDEFIILCKNIVDYRKLTPVDRM